MADKCYDIAHLISAAPELLEALRDAVGVMKLQRDVIERGAHEKSWAPVIDALAEIEREFSSLLAHGLKLEQESRQRANEQSAARACASPS